MRYIEILVQSYILLGVFFVVFSGLILKDKDEG